MQDIMYTLDLHESGITTCWWLQLCLAWRVGQNRRFTSFLVLAELRVEGVLRPQDARFPAVPTEKTRLLFVRSPGLQACRAAELLC